MHKLTISELSDRLGISVQATWKKVKKLVQLNSLTTTKELVNNRETTFVILNDDKLNELISTTQINQPVYHAYNQFNKRNEQVEQQHYQEVDKQVDNQLKSFNYEEVVTRVLDFTNSVHSEMRDLYREISDKDSQVKLLEDSEGRTKKEYQETQALIKELKDKVSIIETENSELRLDITHKNRDIEDLTKSINLVSNEKDLLISENDELKNHKANMTHEIITLKSSINELNNQVNQRQDSINILDLKVNELNQIIADYKNNLAMAEEQKDSFNAANQELIVKNQSLESKLLILEKEKNHIIEVRDKELELEKTKYQNAQDKIIDLENKITELSSVLSIIEAENKQLKEKQEKKSLFGFVLR